MSDWVKVLIGALVGLVAGLVAEPLKQQLSLFIDRRRIRHVLLLDLREIYLGCCAPLPGGGKWDVEEFKEFLFYVRTDKFDYYYTHKRDACYQLPQWRWVEDFYVSYAKIRQEALNDKIAPAEAIQEIRKAFLMSARACDPYLSLLTEVELHFEKVGIKKLNAENLTR